MLSVRKWPLLVLLLGECLDSHVMGFDTDGRRILRGDVEGEVFGLVDFVLNMRIGSVKKMAVRERGPW